MTTEYRARALFATRQPIAPNSNAGSNDFDIQWMPPGPQKPVCFVADEPKELSFTVKPQHATAFNVMLQKMLNDAAAGNGDMPFIDFNHEDGAAAGRPTEFYWGGDDPQSGGIRLKGKWTNAGKASVAGGEFSRFSPEWYFGEDHEPLAVAANLGGLVNRAAFRGIQTVVAKSAAPMAGNTFQDRLNRAVAKHLNPFVEKLNSMNADISAQLAPATTPAPTPMTTLARASQPRINPITAPLPLEGHPFLTQAKALAAEVGISETEARVRVARANWPLYQQFNASVQKAQADSAEKPKPASAVVNKLQEGFLTQVQAKQAAGMTFDDAVSFVSRSRPDLAEQYRQSFR